MSPGPTAGNVVSVSLDASMTMAKEEGVPDAAGSEATAPHTNLCPTEQNITRARLQSARAEEPSRVSGPAASEKSQSLGKISQTREKGIWAQKSEKFTFNKARPDRVLWDFSEL